MTEKRYYERMWEEEYYIFDSQIISEKDFDEKFEYEDYKAFADSMMGDEVVDRLNELNDKYNEIKKQYADDCNEANSLTVKIAELTEENGQLKTVITHLKNELSWIRDYAYWKEKDAFNKLFGYYMITCDEFCIMAKENEQLKQKLSDIDGQLVMLDNCDNWDYDRMKHTVREIAEIIGYNGTINPKKVMCND